MGVWTEPVLLLAQVVMGLTRCGFPRTGSPPAICSASPQVYVLKRPYVDEFLRRMGELFECVLFTASLAKVLGAGGAYYVVALHIVPFSSFQSDFTKELLEQS